MDKITKLSDAIRLGATFHPQCRYAFQKYDPMGNVMSTCALGAALQAIGASDEIPPLSTLMKRFGVEEDVLDDVMDKNDKYGWSRELIADYLASKGK